MKRNPNSNYLHISKTILRLNNIGSDSCDWSANPTAIDKEHMIKLLHG